MQKILSQPGASMRTLWQDAAWYRALTLSERLALFRTTPRSTSSPVDQERAARLLQRWKQQPPFSRGDYFAQRLAMDQLSEDELLSLLAEPIEEMQARMSLPPAWLMRLAAAFEEQEGAVDEGLPLPPGGEERPALAFLNTIRPLLVNALARLKRGIQELVQSYDDLPFDPAIVSSLLFSCLPQRLLPRMSATIVLELNVARMEGRLQGDTPHERFQHFLAQLAQPEHMLPLLEEYSVLARFITETIDRWVICSLELLSRLCADWQEILALFTPQGHPGRLVKIETAGGDSYRGGRMVTLLTWSSGFRLVYKPKSQALDAHFQELLSWLNTQEFQPAFRILNVLNKESYGWSEFVSPAPCHTQEEVERFYVRQGAYLALLYALNANDMHADNIIATGEHPILIDLETLLQPRLLLPADEREEEFDRSLLTIGLLPMPDQQGEEVDISGMGASSGQLTPEPVAVWRGVGTDEMRVERERVKISTGLHRPALLDADVETGKYHEQVAAGFSTAYRLLVQHREELSDQILTRFAHDEVRCLLRDTITYDVILKDSLHPNMLRDALDRDRLLDRLWIAVLREPWLARVISSERSDLQAGDTPLFVTYPTTRDLYDSREQRLADFFARSGSEVVNERLHALGEQDLQRQLAIIEGSFRAMQQRATTSSDEPASHS